MFDKAPVVHRSAVLGSVHAELGTVELSRNASFIQVDLRDPFKHHDSLRFADGSVVKVSTLPLGLEATVTAVTEEAVKKLLDDAAVGAMSSIPEGDNGITRDLESV